jgi:hypothetical protein
MKGLHVPMKKCGLISVYLSAGVIFTLLFYRDICTWQFLMTLNSTEIVTSPAARARSRTMVGREVDLSGLFRSPIFTFVTDDVAQRVTSLEAAKLFASLRPEVLTLTQVVVVLLALPFLRSRKVSSRVRRTI